MKTEYIENHDWPPHIGRCAVFIDVGYLFGAAGQLLLHTSYRPYIECNYAGLVSQLVERIERQAGIPLLRAYWYDAAYNGLPTSEQLEVSALPFVKLRLGRLSAGRQKGVDSLIVRDLMTLSRERAIVTAYLLGGDEDVREGVIEAQDLGTSVVLLGIPGTNQAMTLIREADQHWVLDEDFWKPFFRRVEVSKLSEQEQSVVIGPGLGSPSIAASENGRQAALDVGAEFAREWSRSVSADDVRRVRSQPAWRIPPDIDGELLRAADRQLGFLRTEPELRKSVRAGFYSELARVLAELEASEPETGDD